MSKFPPCHKFATTNFGYRRRSGSTEVSWTSTSIRGGRLSTSAAALRVPPVKGGPNFDETATEPVEMINCREDDLMNYPGATLDPISETDLEAAWFAEIERRVVEIDVGTVELIPWDAVRSELFGESEWRE